MTTRQISDTIEDIYGFDVSEGVIRASRVLISDFTDKIVPQIEEWQNRPLDDVYPVIYIDAIHYSVRDNGVIVKKAAYVILGLTRDGRKEALPLAVGENESVKFRLNALNERGVQDVMTLYGSHGPQHAEIRCIKRYEIFCLRPKDYLQCGFRRRRAESSRPGC